LIVSTPNDLFNLYNLNETIKIQIQQIYNKTPKITKVINGLLYKIHREPTIGQWINKNNYFITLEVTTLNLKIYIYYINEPLEILEIRTKGL